MPYKKKQDKEAPSIKPEKSKHYINFKTPSHTSLTAPQDLVLPSLPFLLAMETRDTLPKILLLPSRSAGKETYHSQPSLGQLPRASASVLPTQNYNPQARHTRQKSHIYISSLLPTRGTATLVTFKFPGIWLNIHLLSIFYI